MQSTNPNSGKNPYPAYDMNRNTGKNHTYIYTYERTHHIYADISTLKIDYNLFKL